jgi:hypothetical protein
MGGKIERVLKIPLLDNIQLYRVLKLCGRYIGTSGMRVAELIN